MTILSNLFKFFKKLIKIIVNIFTAVEKHLIHFRLLIKQILTSFKKDLLQLIYFYLVFYILFELKNLYINHFSNKLIFSGYIKGITLFSLEERTLFLFILIFISLLFICYMRNNLSSPYMYSVIIYCTFNILGVFVVITDQFEILSLLFYLLYGGLVSIVFGLKLLPYEPDWLSNEKIERDIKIELVKISISNWWRGITILTSIIIALFVTALVSWVLAPTPEDLKIFEDFTVKLSFFLFVTALPGLIYIYIRSLKQINYLENTLLYIK